MKKILLFEDDQFIFNIYTELAQKHGIELELANSKEVISQATASKPSLIVLDMLMPNVNGMDLLKALKAENSTKHIPVVILTNLANPALKKEALAEGAKAYIVKSEQPLDKTFTQFIAWA